MSTDKTRSPRRSVVQTLTKLLPLSALLWGHPMVSWAAESEMGAGVIGVWHQAGEVQPDMDAWQAQWIWMPEAHTGDAMLARRSFILEDAPDKAMLRITASSLYQLYINGQYVSRGPARSAPHHQSFDLLDISKLLKAGGNVLAVRVHYQRGTVSYHHEGRPGLLIQLDAIVSNEALSIVSDASWKVNPDKAWDNDVPLMSRFHLEVPDRVDLREHSPGWQHKDFDDSPWPSARALTRNVGWPSHQANDKPRPLME